MTSPREVGIVSARRYGYLSEIFRDGRITSADGKGATGTTRLGDQPALSIEDIASNPEFAVTRIARTEFEDNWNQALDSDAP